MPATTSASWLRSTVALAALLGGLLVLLLTGTAGAATVTIAPGETLSGIAARYGTTTDQLAGTNGIANPNRIIAGTRLTVPGAASRTAAATSTSTSTGGGYRVRAGDTLSGIAARHGTSAGALARANGISLEGILSIGTYLSVPVGQSTGSSYGASAPTASGAAGSHEVTAGETLSAIGARYGVSVAAIAQANGIADANLVVAGERLSIPGATGGAPAAASGGASATGAGVASLLDQASARHGVPADLSRAVAWQESGWQQSARSSVGAIGVMQLMPATAKWFGPAVMGRRINPHSVADNVDAGVAYLSYLRRKLGDQALAVGAYYRGPNAVARHGLGTETQAYVSSVMALRGTV